MTRTGRILFARAADAANFNAQAKNVQNILARWRSNEYQPSVFCFSEPEPRVAANPRVRIIRIRDDRLWQARIVRHYLRGFDAVFCPGLHHMADWLALRVRDAVRWSLPIVGTVEGLLSVRAGDEFERRYAAVAGHKVPGHKVPAATIRRIGWMREHAVHVIAISPFLARQAQAAVGDKVSMLPLGVDTGLFRREYRKGRLRLRVVCAGNVRPHKRPQIFLDLARHFPGADFVWFGEGELRHVLQSRAQAQGLGNVAFPGAAAPPTLAAEFADSDIFVLPSLSEGVPKVTQEAAAASLTQIIFGFYEAPTVIDGRNGFVVWSDGELIERLGALLNDPERRMMMGQAGREMASEWSWDIVAPLWEERIIAATEAAHAARHAASPRPRAGMR